MLRRSLRLRSLVRPSMARQSLRQTRVPLSSKREQKVMFERRQRGQRQNNQQRANRRSPRTPHFGKLALGLATAATVATLWSSAEEKQEVDYDAVRAAIADILDVEDFDDGSLGPILVRLAWHSSGTYDIHKGNGGSAGARMRFSPEADWGANAGLKTARDALEPIKKKFPGISYSDLWTLAGAVAIEEMGGPKITWSPGRVDAPSGADAVEDGRLPDATKGPTHVREIFSRMGFTDREMVALIGAHTFGRCHTQNSGFDGPWTRAPTTFSNLFFVELVQNKWKPRKWSGPHQYADPTGDLMMLPADMALIEDPSFRKYAELYAENQEVFAKDFASAFSKLLENGVPRKSSGPLTIAATIGALSAFGGFKK